VQRDWEMWRCVIEQISGEVSRLNRERDGMLLVERIGGDEGVASDRHGIVLCCCVAGRVELECE